MSGCLFPHEAILLTIPWSRLKAAWLRSLNQQCKRIEARALKVNCLLGSQLCWLGMPSCSRVRCCIFQCVRRECGESSIKRVSLV